MKKGSKTFLFLLVCVLFLTGCGPKSSGLDTAMNHYKEKTDEFSERLEDENESGIDKVYNKTMQRIQDQDYEELEGDNVFDKTFRVLFGGLYRIKTGLAEASGAVFAVMELIGIFMAFFCKKNNQLRRRGIVLMFVGFAVPVIIIAGGLLTSWFVG